jgi:hypothetical protein
MYVPYLFAGASSSEKPYFDDIYSRNVTTVVDDTAILKCIVRNKGERTVRSQLQNLLYYKQALKPDICQN